MPDRIIRESALVSPTLEQVSAEAERLFWRLTLVADDYGRFDADPRVVVSRALPLRALRIALKDAAMWLAELIEAGLLVVYQVGEHIYATFKTWSKYQRTRDSRPKFPAPDEGEPIDAAQYVAWRGDPKNARNIPQSSGDSTPRQLDAFGVIHTHPQALAARARVIEGREPWAVGRGPRAVSREPRDVGRTERASAASGRELPRPAATDAPAPPPYRIPQSIDDALAKAPTLGQVPALRDPRWWQAEVRANPGVDYAAELLKAEAWLTTNKARSPKKNHARFLHNWLRGADREPET